MKTLYIIRHAKSSWRELDLSDQERPLNKRGKLNAPFMAEQLKKKEGHIDHFLSSTAKRAITTATAIAAAFGVERAAIEQSSGIYHAGRRELLEHINALDNRHASVAIFGHNPGFTDLANHLTGEWIDNIPTCGMVKVEFDVEEWGAISGDLGRLVWFDYPKRYPEMQGL